MNLTKLFEKQRELDNRIVKEKGLEGVDLLPKKILALQVELGELANELPETFKFWSNKRNDYKKALKEYVDCLHFSLSIGINVEFERLNEWYLETWKTEDVVTQFMKINQQLTDLWESPSDMVWADMFCYLLGLGEMLGFTWEEVTNAYMEKNAVNHTRQSEGY